MKNFFDSLLAGWWFAVALLVGTRVVMEVVDGGSWESWSSLLMSALFGVLLGGGFYLLRKSRR